MAPASPAKSWWAGVPAPVWTIFTALLLSFFGTVAAVWKTSLELSGHVAAIRMDVTEIKTSFSRHVDQFRDHQLAAGHAGMMTVHAKDQEAITQAFRQQQEFLKAEFGKVDSRLTRIEGEIRRQDN